MIESPALRPDGSIVVDPGYDAATRLYLQPSVGFVLPPIPDQPTIHDVEVGVSLIEEAIGDFPFVDDASRANAVAVLLTPIIRHFIDGQVPLAIFDAPTMGTGKSLLVEFISTAVIGRPAALLEAPESNDELSKRISSALSTGATLINLDNIECRLGHASLAACLTTPVWEARLLGRNDKVIRLAQRAAWVATGNNVRLAGDMARRCYWIRLDAKVERPWKRSGFRIPNLIAWTLENRGHLVAALLTIARAWIVAGKPSADPLPRLGGFQPWASTIAGMLQYVGVCGFLGNADQMTDAADDEAGEWAAFLAEWR